MLPRLMSCTVIATLLTTPLAAQEAFSWVYDAHYPIDPAETQLNLVASQPDSPPDTPEGRLPGGLIWARCAPGGDGGDVVLRLEAFPVSGIPPAQTEAAFQITDGTEMLTLLADLVPRELNEPTGGLEVVVALDGPELAMLASAPIVIYGLVGYTDFQYDFDISGNQDYVLRFLTDCGELAGEDPPPSLPVLPPILPVVGPPDFGPGRTGHVWSRVVDVVEGDPFASRIDLFYGVPQSDDILIHGRCFVGAQGPLVDLEIAADVTGLSDGMAATLRAATPDGRVGVLQGTVIGSRAEVGVSGLSATLALDDPLWRVLAGDTTLALMREGAAEGITLTGDGPNTIRPFLTDCANIGTLDPESGQSPGAPGDAQAGYLGCENLGRVASRDTGAPVVLNFINATAGYRAIAWIDGDGVPVDVTALDPGQAAAYNTDPGHVWMATDGPGNCLELIQPVPGNVDYRLSVEN